MIWDTDRNGINRGHSNLFLSPRSLAKFGSLYLNEGMVDGKEIISKEWVEKSTTMELNNYGYCWWNDMFGYSARAGPFGHYINILPEEDIVVAFTEASIALRILSRYIIPAIIESGSSVVTLSTNTKTTQSNGSTSTQSSASETSGLSLLYPTCALLAIIAIVKRKKLNKIK